MPVTKDYLSYVLEQLASLRSVTSRRMFGGIGLYSDGLFFALLDDDTLFFKTGEENRADYESRGMKRFNPFPDSPPGTGLGYHEVPADVLEEAEQLAAWARKSVAVALSRAAARAQPKRPKKAAAKSPRQKTARAGRKLAASDASMRKTQKRKRRPKAAFK